MLHRTPYSVAPYGIDNYPDGKDARAVRKFAPSKAFIREGYIFVHQDVRGRLMSEGTFVDVRPHATTKGAIDESTDSWDTIDWLVKNVPSNNGRVGSWGISYPGFYAAQTAVDAHPALKAVSPQAPVTDWFMGDDFHHNGAFFLADGFDFYASFGKPRPKPTKKSVWGFDHDVADIYDFFLAMGPLSNANTKYLENGIAFWNEMMAHPTRDEFWKARDPRPYYRNVKPAVMTVGGWFDSEDCYGALETYRAFEKQSPGAENVLVMGPWRHGGWARNDGDRHGDISFGQKTSLHYREEIELPFFRRHLKGKGRAEGVAATEAFVFETGTNVWQTLLGVAAARGEEGDAPLPRAGQARRGTAFRGRGRERLRRVRQRSGEARAVPREDGRRDRRRLHERRPALRVTPPRRRDVRDGRPRRGRHVRRAARGEALRVDHRHRRRLRREARRRVSAGPRRPGPEPHGRAHGRLPAARARPR